MWVFEAEQHAYDIGGVMIGGQPGEYPTVLFGSIFYMGDKLILDEAKGEFDKDKATEVALKMKATCDMAGVPLVLDMIGGSPAAMENYVEWAGPLDIPLLVDGTTPPVRMAGARKVVELGLEARTIFNSIGPETKQAEVDELKELGLKTVMVMCHNVKKPTFQGKFDIAEECLERSREAGFTQFLMDTAVLDLVEPGPCSKAIWMLKNKYGYPAGCSPTHIVIDRWPQGRAKYGKLGYTTAKTSMATSIMMMGADFFMYGIKQLEIVPAMAMVDSCIAYTARQLKTRPGVKKYPLTALMAQADPDAEIRQ
jgi:tetrahydromethanopterin S-methyltransferase subunit H